MDELILKKLPEYFSMTIISEGDWAFEACGKGKVHESFRIRNLNTGTVYFIQKFNKSAFPDAQVVCEVNFDILTHLKQKGVLNLLPIKSDIGNPWIELDGSVYRLMPYVTHQDASVVLTKSHVAHAAVYLQSIHNALRDYQGRLHHWHVHDPCTYLEKLDRHLSMGKVPLSRMTSVKDATLQQKQVLAALNVNPAQFMTVCHNDPKRDNFLFDEHSQVNALVDWDTCSHSSLLWELGDALRSFASEGGVDGWIWHSQRVDIFRQSYFKASSSGCHSGLNDNMILCNAARIISLELSIRFALEAIEPTGHFTGMPVKDLWLGFEKYYTLASVIQRTEAL